MTLSSADPKDPPAIDPKFLAEPFDRRVAIEAVRESLELLDSPHIAKDHIRLAAGPEDRSDEAILVGPVTLCPSQQYVHQTVLIILAASKSYVRKTAMSMWHCSGTVRMGKVGDPDTCVDSQFRVLGVDRLRVVDMSVAPFLLRYVAVQEKTKQLSAVLTDLRFSSVLTPKLPHT